MSGKVSLKIYNVLGQEVMDLTDELSNQLTNGGTGNLNLVWNGRDLRGVEAGSGIYLIAFRLGSSLQVRKAVLLR
jgi:flagellar hook assembly protein FlgD